MRKIIPKGVWNEVFRFKFANNRCVFWRLAFFFGCASPEPVPQYQPKKLEAQGKGITVAKSTPYNCKILGEAEGKDNTNGAQGVTRERLREGAINDLKNEAGDVAGEGKRAMISITKENIQCSIVSKRRFFGEDERKIINCTNVRAEDEKDAFLLSHRIHAQIFDCGAR